MEDINAQVTRADLDKQLEVHAKAIELQILLSQQIERIQEKLDVCHDHHEGQYKILETLERRTWKQGWLFWGLIFSILSSSIGIIAKLY